MIPISLTVEGLYSYQKAQTIDFGRLTDARLFGIFGSTGSGKSSILEAISFALYGECERLNRNNRSYNMMNLRSRRLYIDFEFELAKEPSPRYRFVAEGKRNSRQFEKIGTIQRQAYQWKNDTWVPVKLTTAESLLGLSYENFKRTIIIPQGKFQEFLLLGNKDRSLMLQEIFGLKKFELSGQVIGLVRQNDQHLQTQEVLLQQYAAITKEGIERLVRERRDLDKEKSQIQHSLKTLEKEREGWEQLKTAFERLANLESQWDTLTQRQEEFAQREKRWQQYLTCLNQFKDPLARRKEYVDQLEQLEASLKRRQNRYQQLESELAEQQKSFNRIEKAYTEREFLQQDVTELESLIELKGLERVLDSLQQRVEKGESEIRTAENRLNGFRSEWQTWEANIREQRGQRMDPQDLINMQRWYAERKSLKERLKQEESLLDEVLKKIVAAKREKQQVLVATPLDPRQYDLSTQKQLVLLKEEIHRLEGERQRHEQEVRTQALQVHLSQLNEELQDGEPCPVCGSVHHPGQPQTPSFPHTTPNAQQTRDRIQVQIDALHQVIPTLRGLTQRARELGQEQKQRKNAITATQEALEAHQTQFVWKELNEQAISELLATARQLNAQIADLEKKRRSPAGEHRR